MMKIGVNTLFLIPGEVGGSETYLRDILRHAVGRHPDVEWILFTNVENHESFRDAYATAGNVHLWPLGVRARHRAGRIIREQCLLPFAVRKAGVDVLWSPGYTAPGWAPCPQVVSVLDMQYREFPQDLSPLALLATRVLVPLAVRTARRVITLSEFSRSQIVKHVNVGRDKIIPIHLAVGKEFGEGMTREEGEGRRNALIPREPYVLCVAHTYPHKNVHTLVEAFGMMGSETGCNLVLVGTEQRGEPLVVKALSTCGGRGRVIRLKGLDRRDLIALYRGASVFAFPSLYEGFGLPVLEAMTAGAPVVTMDAGPMREIGGETLRYFDGTAPDLARQLKWALGIDATAREDWVRESRERAATYSWERTADQTLEVLRSACS